MSGNMFHESVSLSKPPNDKFATERASLRNLLQASHEFGKRIRQQIDIASGLNAAVPLLWIRLVFMIPEKYLAAISAGDAETNRVAEGIIRDPNQVFGDSNFILLII